jgi:hypothetical protein
MQKKRFVEYQNCLSFEHSPLIHVLRYLCAYQNLYDLEFFQCKISSESFTVADAEQRIFSGLPFWDMNEELLLGLKPDNESLITDENGSFISHFGTNNQLAT